MEINSKKEIKQHLETVDGHYFELVDGSSLIVPYEKCMGTSILSSDNLEKLFLVRNTTTVYTVMI